MDDGDYQQVLREDCLLAAGRYGFPVRTFSAANDSGRQIEQIQTCLSEPKSQRPTVFLISPVSDCALVSIAYQVAREGIGWVLLGRWSNYLPDLRASFPRLPVFSVAADQREVGRIQGQQFKTLLPDGGEVVYVRGPLGTSSAGRRWEGVQEAVAVSRVNLFPVTSDWSIAGGARAMKDWLQIFGKQSIPKVVVGAQNDAMAMGARDALEQLARARPDFNLDQVRITGCDGSPHFGRRLVSEGKLAATVVMPPSAGAAVNALAGIFAGTQQRPAVEITLGPASFPAIGELTWSALAPRT